jgi:hypothetical protein
MLVICRLSVSFCYHAEFQEVCYQKHTISDGGGRCETKQSFIMDEEKLIILVQGHVCLYNLQHDDYDNNLVKDNCWKERAVELHAQDKELSRRTQRCRRIAR